MIELIDKLLPILVILAQVVIAVLLIALIISKLAKKQNEVLAFFSKHAVLFAFLVALTATSGSLFYSEILGYEPCKLCWFQRILMYPQVITLGLALWLKDRGAVDSSIALSGLGAMIAGWHYYNQIAPVSNLPCAAVGYSASCAQRFILEYGYITIPLMSLTAFVLIFLLMTAKKFSHD